IAEVNNQVSAVGGGIDGHVALQNQVTVGQHPVDEGHQPQRGDGAPAEINVGAAKGLSDLDIVQGQIPAEVIGHAAGDAGQGGGPVVVVVGPAALGEGPRVFC